MRNDYLSIYFILFCCNLDTTTESVVTTTESAATTTETSTTEDLYYVDDGCHSEGSTPDDITGFYQSETSEAYVRCCSDDGTSCKTPSTCRDDEYLVSYADAETECAGIGMRICTKDELLTDMCCGTGGGCDSEGVWTSTIYGIHFNHIN